jgi:hypothetical protein
VVPLLVHAQALPREDSRVRTSMCYVTVAVALGSGMGAHPSPRGLTPRRDMASRFFTQIYLSSVVAARSMIAVSKGSADRGGRIHGHASKSDAVGRGQHGVALTLFAVHSRT